MPTIKKDHSKAAKKIRKGISRKNRTGGESTHLMISGEADGRYYAHPTLFPKEDRSGWIEYRDKNQAFDEANKRGEIFEFKTKKEAEEFAEGSWKKKDINKYNRGGKVKSSGLFNFPSKEGRIR